MIPSAANSDYPKFVANQVLTSDNLNDLFGYLDEQVRITRTNLLGIGIVCGLQVKTGADADGKYIIITKGAGVTSEGYLVTVPEIKYYYYNTFDAVKCKYYDPFVNIGDKTQKLPLWELKQEADTEDLDNPFRKLDDPAVFLNNKIVLLFVELLEANNKNCDPNSCDDKGTMVTVNFRPLLAAKSDVETFLSNQSGGSVSGNAVLLNEIKMPRYDVASTLLLDSEDIFQAYQDVLTTSFISSVKSALSDSWSKLNSILADDFPADPFSNLESQFAFLQNGNIFPVQTINLQYFYDFFSDLLLGYSELRRKAFDVICECLPDESLFPRHLLLGEAIGFNEVTSQYRTRFISSPLLCCCADDAKAVKSLFRRLVLMIENFAVPGSENGAFDKTSLPIRITPSLLGKEPLSEKAIPFYYKVNNGSLPLYKLWNQERTRQGTADQILSYRSIDYNTVDDFVKHPLKYDLEPSNFLRIEGHIGQDYRTVMADIQEQKLSNRLPFDVVALSSDTRGIFNITEALTSMDTTGSIAAAFEIIIKHPACFADIFLALDEWMNKLRCCLLESRKYFMELPSYDSRGLNRNLAAGIAGNMDETAPPQTEFTIGKLYEEKIAAGTIDNQVCNDLFVNIATNEAHVGSALVMMPYKIDSMMSALPDHITKLDAKELEYKYADLTGSSSRLRTMYASPNVAENMSGVDLARLDSRLEMNCLVCLFLELRLLIREFLIRLLGLMIKQKLGYYAYTNPGIQHKAGVPMGGTFVLVYHEQTQLKKDDTRKDFVRSLKNVTTKGGNSANSIFSGDQPLLSSILLLDELLFLKKVNEVTEEPNEVLDKIVQNIQPGTVIADFYVPYLCCSDCPPSQMVLLPAPEEPNLPPVAKAAANPDLVMIAPNGIGTSTLDSNGSIDPEGKPLSFKWTLPSGTTGATITDETKPVATATFTQPGTCIFTLTVTDDKGEPGTATASVEVKMEEVVEKTCGPLSNIIAEYDNWLKLVRKSPNFIEFFPSHQEVADYFKTLKGILTEPVEKQIEFFASAFNDQSTPDLIIKWLSELHSIIQERKDLRLLALLFYRILILLSMYIVCIQNADFDKAEVKMIEVFNLIRSHIKTWLSMISEGIFTEEDIAVVKDIGKDLEKEIKRVNDNGEATLKNKYVTLLEKIRSMIAEVLG